MSEISHALVIPDKDFFDWLQAIRPYTSHFERVSVLRGTGGKDLNPYRNVTAVNAPNVWMPQGPLYHVRRIYPQVVRVDVINASTPQALATILQTRINSNDRFGELNNGDNHIDDRFVLEWATDYRPLKLTSRFTENPTGSASDNMGIGIGTESGEKVLVSVAGTVTKQWASNSPDALNIGKYVQVTTQHEGKTYIVTYGNLGSISVPLNTWVTIGDEIGRSAGSEIRLIVQQVGGGFSGYRLPNIIDPTPLMYVTGLRVRPVSTGLRVRTIPVDGDIITSINPWDFVTPKESHPSVLKKVGVEGEWLRVRSPIGQTGYTAAWFLSATTFKRYALDINPLGVNLDINHPQGTPDATQLGGLGWVRFGYNVSNGTGSEDIQAAYNRYAPIVERYARAGYKVAFTTSHQTYGEAKGFPTWHQMTDADWTRLIQRFAEMMGQISHQWRNSGLVHCWQVWNEQDAPLGATSSVPMSSANYHRMLEAVVPAIRSADSEVDVVTGGHTSGPVAGANYAREAITGLSEGAQVDGIAFHPYGRGTNTSSPYAPHGHIDESIQKYSQVLPEKPLWITEWGVLDRPDDNPQDVANYATNFISHVKAKYPGQIACLIWYAWAQGMHNGFGIVDSSGQSRAGLSDRFLQA